jgi:non-ribosomal peptide synthetase component F
VLLLTGLTILLNRYSGNDDIMIGTSILKQETEGEFLNTVLVMRNRLDNQMSFKELLIQVKATVKEANENPNYPVKRLLEHLDIRKTSNSFPLFDTVILLENIHMRNM